MQNLVPNFGPTPRLTSDAPTPVEQSGAATPVVQDVRTRSKSPRSPMRPKVNPFVGNEFADVRDSERGELYAQLHKRYQELRSVVTDRRAELGKLRSEYSTKVAELRGAHQNPVSDDSLRGRLDEATEACLSIIEEIKREREEPLTESEKMFIVKEKLADVQTWNVHVASFMRFFRDQQMHAIRQVQNPVAPTALPTAKHWTP